jgi:hypothetical protein
MEAIYLIDISSMSLPENPKGGVIELVQYRASESQVSVPSAFERLGSCNTVLRCGAIVAFGFENPNAEAAPLAADKNQEAGDISGRSNGILEKLDAALDNCIRP